MDAFWNLLAEWEKFEQEWNAFYPTLEALGIELGELPSYLENLEASWKAEREGRKADEEAHDKERAADRLALDDMTAERDGWRIGTAAASIAALVAFLLCLGGR